LLSILNEVIMELFYERDAMHGEPLPADLSGLDILVYMALCDIYGKYNRGELTREQGTRLKNKVIAEYKHYERETQKRADMWKRIESRAHDYVFDSTIENADRFYAAVYNVNDDWRVKR